jgi:diguanylate cyclase (GGDEF)-like protein
MINYILLAAICVSLGIAIYIAVYTHLYCKSEKRRYFLLCMVAIIVYVLGHMFELMSESAEEAFTALKMHYLGAMFVAVFAFFFVADYCEIKLPALRVRLPLIAVAGILVLIMWTTKIHRLIYDTYRFQADSIHYLQFDPGPLYVLVQIFTLTCLVASLILLLYRMPQWKKHRSRTILLMICVSTPLLAESIYFLLEVFSSIPLLIYPTPYSLTVMSVLFYICITRYDMFDITPSATALALDSIKEAYVLVDEDMNYLLSNPAACSLFKGLAALPKWSPINTIENWPYELAEPEAGAMNRTIDFSLNVNDKIRHYSASVNALLAREKKNLGWVILIQDVTDSRELLMRLEGVAYTDALTGIYNRRYFMEPALMNFTKAKRSETPCYALMLDLDFFKRVNDTYGHFAGDAVLRKTAAQIKFSIRSYDLFARYGGEEFVVLLTDIDKESVLQLAERIRHDIADLVCRYEGAKISITASIGVAESTDAESLEALLKNADTALYAAKSNGRNQILLYESDGGCSKETKQHSEHSG